MISPFFVKLSRLSMDFFLGGTDLNTSSSFSIVPFCEEVP